MPSLLVIERVRGDDWSITLDIATTNAAGVVTPYDLTSCTIRATIGTWTGTTSGGAIAITNAVLGAIAITVPKLATAAMAPTVYRSDIEVTTATGAVLTVLIYNLRVIGDVTI